MTLFDGKKFIADVEALPAAEIGDMQGKTILVGAARGFVALITALERLAAAAEILAKPPAACPTCGGGVDLIKHAPGCPAG